jgi:KDO2-lipid IV(A) lauroyltransferase
MMKDRLRRLRKRCSAWSLVVIVWTIRFITLIIPYRAGVACGPAFGLAAYALLKRERTRTQEHLARAFPDKDRAWILSMSRQCFMHLGTSVFEVMLVSPKRLAKITEFHGTENLDKALALGKGVIFATGHIGNWELMAGGVGSRFPLSVVAAAIEPEPVNRIVVNLRQRAGAKIILRGRPGASKELIRIFRENRVLGLLIDQDTDVDGAFVDFFGTPAWTPTAAASMAAKFHAPIVFGHIKRLQNGKHAITVEGPLDLVSTGNPDRDLIANTALLTKKIEDCIRSNPAQWVWMHRRWRRQP